MRKSIKTIGLFGGLFHFSGITKTFHIFFYIICAIILQLTAYYPRKILETPKDTFITYRSLVINKMAQQFKILEYPLIILFIISGAIFLMSSSDLISMFLSIELQSYGLYILTTIYKNSEKSTKAGLTYFLLGGLSSCFILLGSSLLYSNTGTTNLDGIYVIASLTSNTSNLALFSGNGYEELASYITLENKLEKSEINSISLPLIIMIVGFLFKVSAAPFHFWSPDVYDAIPTVVTTFVAIVGKISIFIFLAELLHYTGRNFISLPFYSNGTYNTNAIESEKEITGYLNFSDQGLTWVNVLLVSCLLSLIVGTVLGLTQNRIKRLFAYSTISHIGFILLALSIDSIESTQAFLFYIMQYSLSNLNAFIILISIGYIYYLGNGVTKGVNVRHKELIDQNNSPIQFISEIKGLFYINPILALSLSITIFSFVGIPPLIGFFGKQMVLSAALDSGYYFITVVAILTSVISAVYYLNIIKEIFFYPLNNVLGVQEKIAEGNKEKNIISFAKNSKHYIVLSSYLTITVSILTLGIVLFMFVPKEWLSIINILTINFYNL